MPTLQVDRRPMRAFRCEACRRPAERKGFARLCDECARWGAVERARFVLATPVETYACQGCGSVFSRERKRGQRPKWCSACQRPTTLCPECGERRRASRKSCAHCQEVARQRRLPVLHPNPDPLTRLPDRHPARRPAIRRTDWWKFFVSGPCEWCGVVFTGLAASIETAPRFCSDRCVKRASERRRGKFVISAPRRLAIYERDGWICQLCFDPVEKDLPSSDVWAATLDHIVCQSWGEEPDHSDENLRLAHRWCNSVRGDESWYTEADLRVA